MPGPEAEAPPLLARLRRWGPAATLRCAEGSPATCRPAPAGLVAAYAAELGTGRMRIAASLYLQRYAYRLLTPAVVAWVTEDAIPDLCLANTRVRTGPGREVSFTMLAPTVASGVGRDAGTAWFARRLVREHLDPVLAGVRDRFHLSPGPLRVNAAAPLMYTLAVCDRVPALRRRTGAVREGMLAAIFGEDRPRLIGADQRGGGRLLLLERRCCCMKRLLPGAAPCAECPLVPAGERGARLRELALRDQLLPDLRPPPLARRI